MVNACEISNQPGIQGICGLLEKGHNSGSDPEGFILELREIVKHFQITWGVTPLHESHSGGSVEIGFVLDLNGSHEGAAVHRARTCQHCANLMLALRIIGDWLFPRQGKCSFCELQAYSNFVRRDQQGQPEMCSTRALRLVSRPGTRCQLGACHIWCKNKMTEQLSKIGVLERNNSLPAEKIA